MKKASVTQYLPVLVGVIAAVLLVYLGYQYYAHTQKITMLLEERNYFLNESRTTEAQLALATSTIADLEEELDDLKDDLEDLADDYRDERNRNEEFEDQIRGLAGTLGDLDKLANTDEELLMKYSRVSFLNENYIPKKLQKISDRYVWDSAGDEYFLDDAYDFLEDMMQAADRADVDLQIVSAYRSFEYQTELKGRYLITYGEGANAFSADQGFSEHQLGTSVDFTSSDVEGSLDGFETSEAYEWLLDNAHKYGFILSYPENNQFYIFEPWHWRFVGEDLARDLHREDAQFYDWDQREIDEYLLTIFD